MLRIIKTDTFLTSSETTLSFEPEQCAPPQLLRDDCTVVAMDRHLTVTYNSAQRDKDQM